MRRLGMFGLGSLDVGIELRGLAPVAPWKNPRSSLGGLTCHQLVSMRSVSLATSTSVEVTTFPSPRFAQRCDEICRAPG